MSNLSTLPKGDSAWLLRKAIERIIQQVSVLETNIGASTSGNSANTQIIFNDNGTLRGDAGLVYNKTTDTLTAGSAVVTGAATITGDLTVHTSTLKVDSTNNRVGVVNATPSFTLDVNGAGNVVCARISSGSGTGFRFDTTRNVSGLNRNYLIGPDILNEGWFSIIPSTALGGGTFTNSIYNASSDGIHAWSNGAGSELMRLNSTGLGIAVSPTAAKLQVGSSALSSIPSAGATGHTFALGATAFGLAAGTLNTGNSYIQATRWDGSATNYELVLQPNGGNVGIGITPSAWATATTVWRALDLQYSCGIASSGAGSGEIDFLWNAYYDQTDQRWEFKYTGDRASRYAIGGAGVHTWYNTASTGTANTAITWNQAMTLDASGRLFVGATAITAGFSGNNYLIVGGVVSPTIKLQSTTGPNAWDIYTANGADLFVAKNSSDLGSFNSTTGVYTPLSDVAKKRDFEPSNIGLAEVLQLQPKLFRMVDDADDAPKELGFVAQDVKSVIPQAYVEQSGQNGKFIGLQDRPIIAALTRAIQELTARVQTLEAR